MVDQQQQQSSAGDSEVGLICGLSDSYASSLLSDSSPSPSLSSNANAGGLVFEGVQLDRFLRLYYEVLKHSNYYENIDSFAEESDDADDKEEDGEKEEDEEKAVKRAREREKEKKDRKAGKQQSVVNIAKGFQSIKSSFPMSHTNALMHMKQILWHHPESLIPSRMNVSKKKNIALLQKQQKHGEQDKKQQKPSGSASSGSASDSDQAFNSLESVKSSQLFFQFLFDLLGDKNDMMRYKGFQLLQDYCRSLVAGSISAFSEPIIQQAISTLMKIIDTTSNSDIERMSASSALVSLVVARDDPALTFKIIKYILNSKFQSFLPTNLKQVNEDYIPLEKFDFKKSAVYDAADKKVNITSVYSMITDGAFVYVHCDLGLLKLSLGQMQYKVVLWKKDYHLEGDDDSSQPSSSSSSTPSPTIASIHSWMFILGDSLYFRSSDMTAGLIAQLSTDSFEESFVSAEAGDCPLGQYPYTLFFTTNNTATSTAKSGSSGERLGVVELISEPKKSIFPETRLRYLSLVNGAFVQEGASQPLPLWSKTTKLQQVNNKIIGENNEDALLASLESYNILKIFTCVRGGLYFLNEDKCLYFLGKSPFLVAEKAPKLLSIEDKTVLKFDLADPDVLILDSGHTLHSIVQISNKNTSNLKPVELENIPKTFKTPFLDVSKSDNKLYIISNDNELGRITDMQGGSLKTFDGLKVKSIISTSGDDAGCYIIDNTPDAALHFVTNWENDFDVIKAELPGGLNEATLLVHAKYSSVVVVNASGIYVKGNNVFGQLGLGHYKNVKDFTRITSPLPFEITDIEKIEIGLTFTLFLVKDGIHRRIYYSGNVKELKQTNQFAEYQHHNFNSNCIESIIDISATDYGFSILKECLKIDLSWASLTFNDISVFSDRKCLGVLLPPASAEQDKPAEYLLFNNSNAQLLAKSSVLQRQHRIHLSKMANFEFNTASQQLVMLDNKERNGHPFNPRVSLTSPKESVDPLVLVNTLLERYTGTAKSLKLTVPSLTTEYVQTLPKKTLFVAKQSVKEGKSPRVSTTFVKVNQPILLWEIQLTRSKECEVTVKVESDSSHAGYSQQHIVTGSKIQLSYPLEMAPNVSYKITIISTELDSVMMGSSYSSFLIDSVQFNLTPPTEYAQMTQVVNGLTFSKFPSGSLTIEQTTLGEKTIPKDALIELFDSLQTLWNQFVGSIEMHNSLQNGAKDQVVDTLLLLEKPLNLTINLLANNIQVLLDDVVLGSRVISLLHSFYCNKPLIAHRQYQRKMFNEVMTSIQNLFIKAFPHIYSSPMQRASAVYLIHRLVKLGGADTFPGATYLLTSMIQSLFYIDIKTLFEVNCEEDAFSRESIDPSLVDFYDLVQNEIYQLMSSKKSQKQKMIAESGINFKDVIMSIASSNSSTKSHDIGQPLDDYRRKSIDFLKFIWSSFIVINKDDVVVNQPKVHTVTRFNSTRSSWSYDEMMDAISFKADKDIYVVGIGLYGDKGSYSAQVGYAIGKTANLFTSANAVKNAWTNKTARYVHRIDFNEPFFLPANTHVTVFSKISGPSSSSGYSGKDSVSTQGVVFKFSNAQVNSDNGTSTSSGQIPQIYFQFEPVFHKAELTPKMLEDTYLVSKMILDTSKNILKDLALQYREICPQLDELRADQFLQSMLPFIIDSFANVKYKFIDKQQKLATLQEFLEYTTMINSRYRPVEQSKIQNLQLQQDSDSSQYSIRMESSHPYEECTKQTNVVEFPADIKWMTVQFDSRSVTNQPSDRLFIWLDDYDTPLSREGFSEKDFPGTTFIVPGNKLIFDFQSASNPANFNENNRYGYSAHVIGFKVLDDNQATSAEDNDYPLASLERLLSFYILQISSATFFDQNERGFIGKPTKTTEVVEAPKRKKKKDSDSESSGSESEKDNKDGEEESEEESKEEEEDFNMDKIIVSATAAKRNELKSKLYFKDIWSKLSKKLEANPKHQYGTSDQVLLDFISAKSGTLGEEVSEFFSTIGMNILNKIDDNKKKDEKDKKKDKDADKKKEKEKEKEKEKVAKDAGEKKSDGEKDDGDKKEKKEKKPEDKFKNFPINSDDLLSVSEKLTLRRLSLLMKRKKYLSKEWKKQKKHLNNLKDIDNDQDSSGSDSSSSSSESSSSSSSSSEEEESWDEEIADNSDDEEKKDDLSDKANSTGKEEDGTDIEEEIKVNIKENGSATEDKDDSDTDAKESDGEDGDESSSSSSKPKTSTVDNSANQSSSSQEADKSKEERDALAQGEEKKHASGSKEKECISTFIKFTGWDTIVKKLFAEIIRLNCAENDFAIAMQSVKNQKKTFQEAKDSEQLRPFIELWRLVQKKINKWALQQSTVIEEYVGICNMFGEDDYNEPVEPTTKKDVLPNQKFDFIFEFLSHLTHCSSSSPSSSSSSSSLPKETSTSDVSTSGSERRPINYSFEEFMSSSNINTSTYNLLLLSKNSQDSKAEGKEKVHTSSISLSILALFLDDFTKIDFFETINNSKRKNLVKIEALRIWSNLVETLQVPSALENTIWMIATILHTNQAPKALLPADWQGKVAQNLSITSNINPLLKKEFIHEFHILLETLSKRIKFGAYSDAIILNALSCFSIFLLPEDISFVQNSEIFPLISKILSEVHSNESRSIFSPMRKGKEKLTPQELDAIEQSAESGSSSASGVASPLLTNSLVPILNSSFINIANKCKVVLTKSAEMMPSLFDESTQSFWEASAKGMINVTLPGEKPTMVREVCLYIDNTDDEFQVMSIKVKAGNSESCNDFSKVVGVDSKINNWVVIPVCGTFTHLNLSFTGSESIRVRQLKILIPDKQENIQASPNSKFDATLSLLKLLTFQIFGISTNKQISKDLRNQVASLLSSNGVSKIQKQIFSLISSEVQKEIIHLDGIGWSTFKDQPNKDAYLTELLTTLSSLMDSEEGKSFIPSKSSIFALLPLLHKGGERIQQLCINICKGMLINLKPTLFTEFMQEQSNVTISNLSFVQYLLLIISKPINLQVKGGSNPLAHNYTVDSLLPGAVEGELSISNGKELIELLKYLVSKSESWRQAIEDELVSSIESIRVAATQSIHTYLNSTKLWSALSSLIIVFDNQKIISAINASNASSETQVKTCQNHDDGVTEASVLCNNCQTNLCSECDRFIHMPKSKREHVKSSLVNDVISLEVHENCIRLKLSSTLFVLDCEKQKVIVQTINISSSETCRFCKQKLDLQNLIPFQGISNVCSAAECRQKAAQSCPKTHQCGHLCYGIRDEEECLPCLHGCKQQSLSTETTTNEHSHGKCKKLTQDQDDFCMICWTENLSEAPSIQLECGHIFHQDCSKKLLEKRWNGARITLGFSKCPICKTSIHHPSLKSITDVIDNIGNEIIRKGKLRIDFLGIQKDPLLMPGGKYHDNLEGYISDQFAYYLCFKCKQPYFGGSNQCAVALAAPDNFNPEELICGGCSSDELLPICPKHGKDYLEFKCRYCCSVAIWFCFGTHHFCETCHNRHTELTAKSSHPLCPVGPGGIELPGDECPLHVDHPKTGTEFALGCGICRNVREF